MADAVCHVESWRSWRRLAGASIRAKESGRHHARTQLAAGQGPVFVSGVIDETGKLQSLRSIRAQDARSQPAIQALQQWQFLPAQLDGRPVGQ